METQSLEIGNIDQAWGWTEFLPTATVNRAKSGEVFTEIDVPLTEDLATAFLESMALNRRLNRSQVYAIKRDIEGGKWKNTHIDPMAFGPDGTGQNGMHRCHARLSAGEDILVDIVFNVERNEHGGASGAFTAATILSMRGESNAGLLASTGRMLFLSDVGLQCVGANPQMAYPDEVETADTITVNHPRVRKSAEMVSGRRFPWGLSRPWLVWLHYRGAYHNQAWADNFILALSDPLTATGPLHLNILALRHHLGLEREKGRKLVRRARLSWLIQAWSASASGREMGTFTWNPKVGMPSMVPPPKE